MSKTFERPSEAVRLGPSSRVLVTGGFGFLGGHILEQLITEGVERIHVVDDLSTSPVSIEVLLDDLPQNSFLTYDICKVADYLRNGPEEFDVILHLASVVGPAGVLKHGGRIVSSIVDDTYALADYALEYGSRLVDVSTSEIYGGGRDGLCAEHDSKIVPAETSYRIEYAVGKLAAETALLNLQSRVGLDVVIVRPFNIAGPRQSGSGGFVLPRFIAQARLGLPLTVFGDGQARRAFSHVKDLSDGIIRAARFSESGEAYNLGNHENVLTVEDLADRVLAISGSNSTKEFVDPRTIYGPDFTEANDKFPAAGRAISDLGWKPTAGVDEIVRDTWDYTTASSAETFASLAGEEVMERLLESQIKETSTR